MSKKQELQELKATILRKQNALQTCMSEMSSFNS